MPSVNEIAAFLEHLAPRNLAEDWDNVGLLVGDRQSQVERLLTCLTLTPDVAEEALTLRAQLIVSHHPILFRPVQKLTSDDPQGKMLLQLITGGIAKPQLSCFVLGCLPKHWGFLAGVLCQV